MTTLKTLANCIERLEHYCVIAAGITLFLMVVLTVYETMARYAFHAPVEWAIELPGYTLTLATAFALAFTQKVRGHIAVGLLEEHLSLKNRARLNIVLLLLYLGTIVFTTWAMFRLMQLSLTEGRLSIVMQVPLFIPNLIILFGFVLYDLQVMIDFVQALNTARK